jgi:hypothetical protein
MLTKPRLRIEQIYQLSRRTTALIYRSKAFFVLNNVTVVSLSGRRSARHVYRISKYKPHAMLHSIHLLVIFARFHVWKNVKYEIFLRKFRSIRKKI